MEMLATILYETKYFAQKRIIKSHNNKRLHFNSKAT